MAEGPATNLLASLKRVVATLIAIAATRLELFIVEFEEERVRVGRLLLYAALALVCLALSIILLTFLIIVLFWDTHRVAAIAVLLALNLGAAGILWRTLMTKAREKPRLFSSSLAELQRDRDQLRAEQTEEA